MGKRRDQVRRLRPSEVNYYRKLRNFLQIERPAPDEIAGVFRWRYADIRQLMDWDGLEEYRHDEAYFKALMAAQAAGNF